MFCCRAQRHNFRVRRGIAIANSPIAAPRNDLSAMHQHRANRHFARGRSSASLFERFLHKLHVDFHASYRVASNLCGKWGTANSGWALRPPGSDQQIPLDYSFLFTDQNPAEVKTGTTSKSTKSSQHFIQRSSDSALAASIT